MKTDNTNADQVLGKHFIIELCDCDPEKLKKLEQVKEVLHHAAIESKATILHDFYYQFEPYGVSGYILIAESHFSIHTWPEHAYASVDIQTCGDTMQPEVAIEIMKEGFGVKDCQVKIVNRGMKTAD